MPMYDYKCEKCNEFWEEHLSMSNNKKPCGEKCPHCGEKNSVILHIGGFPGVNVDTTLTADKVTGGRWSEITNRIKSSLPDRYSKNVRDDMSGHRWKG
tara:strand:- start:1058 stop:1351 length:294 start_codon:yes stop_codon:yes gene_type:complete